VADLAARSVIDQATGIVMAENRCSAGEAQALLRAAAQDQQQPVATLAAAIVEALSTHPLGREE